MMTQRVPNGFGMDRNNRKTGLGFLVVYKLAIVFPFFPASLLSLFFYQARELRRKLNFISDNKH
jgi:hypothetical protein